MSDLESRLYRALRAGDKADGKPVERPILMNSEMVRAVLDGRKTQTRRLVRSSRILCPFGAPGDRLWVRETWRAHLLDDVPTPRLSRHVVLRYSSDHNADPAQKWRPSIHMPRWASRITLEVTDVRVERLQAINADDARAEGARRFERGSLASSFTGSDGPGWSMGSPATFGETLGSAQMAFANLWENLYGETASWNSNPWVWRVAFRRIEQP